QRGVVLDVRMAPGSGLDPDGVSWHPAEAVSNVVRHADGSTQLLVDPDASSLELGHPEACPTHVDLSTIDSDHTIVTLRPWIDVGPPDVQIGYGQAFERRVTPGCRDATKGTIAWTQVEGSPVNGLESA